MGRVPFIKSAVRPLLEVNAIEKVHRSPAWGPFFRGCIVVVFEAVISSIPILFSIHVTSRIDTLILCSMF